MNGRIPISTPARGHLSAAAIAVWACLAQAFDRASSTARAALRRGLSACLRRAPRLHRTPSTHAMTWARSSTCCSSPAVRVALPPGLGQGVDEVVHEAAARRISPSSP